MESRYLFLDFDGVLNNRPFLVERSKKPMRDFPWDEFDPGNLHHLNSLLFKMPDVRIVLSTSWRDMTFLLSKRKAINFMRRLGISLKWIAHTPRLDGQPRGDEIHAYCLANGVRASQIVIVDDDGDMHPYMSRLVQTDFETGLTQRHIERAITLLK